MIIKLNIVLIFLPIGKLNKWMGTSLAFPALLLRDFLLNFTVYMLLNTFKLGSMFSSAVFEENVEVLSQHCRRRLRRRRSAKTFNLTFYNISVITEDVLETQTSWFTIKRGTSRVGYPQFC